MCINNCYHGITGTYLNWDNDLLCNNLKLQFSKYSSIHTNDITPHAPLYNITGLEICGILVANATMFSHLLPGFSSGSKHLLLP